MYVVSISILPRFRSCQVFVWVAVHEEYSRRWWCDVVALGADHGRLEPDGFGLALRGRSEYISAHTY